VKSGVTNVIQFTVEEYENWKRFIKEFERYKDSYLELYSQTASSVYGKATAYEEPRALRNRFASTDRERKKGAKTSIPTSSENERQNVILTEKSL
jgi:hypothetical protein